MVPKNLGDPHTEPGTAQILRVTLLVAWSCSYKKYVERYERVDRW
jgi:hypothetical protein